jgi:hypothetical protein
MNCKILKLSNGEELIADVEEQSDSFLIHNPMVFLTSTMSDMNGIPVDVTFLKDWLNNSDNKSINIQKDRVVAITDAGKKTAEYYDMEKKKNDSEQKEISDEEMKNFIENVDKMVEDLFQAKQEEEMNNYDESTPYEEYEEQLERKRRKKRKKKKESPFNMIPKEFQERPMIYLNMVIPPEALMNLISAGILDVEMIQTMVDEVKKKNKFTGDEKTRKDFGNKFSDWNPDPKSDDYN